MFIAIQFLSSPNSVPVFPKIQFLSSPKEAKLDLDLAQKLVDVGREGDGFGTVLGKTISTNDFYEGQVGFCKAIAF